MKSLPETAEVLGFILIGLVMGPGGFGALMSSPVLESGSEPHL